MAQCRNAALPGCPYSDRIFLNHGGCSATVGVSGSRQQHTGWYSSPLGRVVAEALNVTVGRQGDAEMFGEHFGQAMLYCAIGLLADFVIPFIVWVWLLISTQRGFRRTFIKYSWVAFLAPLGYVP